MTTACHQEPTPAGWKVWSGPVPPELTQIAMDYRDRINSYPYGQIIGTSTYNGQTVAVFKSHHQWTYKPGQGLVTGICIPGVSLLTPLAQDAAGTAPQDTTQPDPNLAMWGADTVEPPQQTDWFIVGVCGVTIGAVGVLFWQALKVTGKAAVREKKRRR